MDQAYYEEWASKIKSFVLVNDLNRIKYYLGYRAHDIKKTIICTNVHGKSALLDACALQRYSIIRYFVENCKVDVNIYSDEGITPVYRACALGDVALLEYLCLNGGNIYLHDDKLKTLIMTFVSNASICNVLISRKVDIHSCDIDGNTALDYALLTSSIRTLELLLQNGASVNQPNLSGIYPIEEACRKVDRDSLRLLLHYGASVDIKGKDGKTLLMQFIKSFDICEILLQNSISVNVKDYSGMTAIHYAIDNDVGSRLLELLLSFGADINAKNNNGLTPAALVIHRRVIYCLKYLLQKGADVDAVDVNGSSLLHHAVEAEDLDVIKVVTNYNINVNVQNNKGMEPIILAACRDNSEIVEYFIQHLDVENVSKIHALELLASNRLSGLNHDQAVSYLKSAMDWRLSNRYNITSATLLNDLFPNIHESTTVDEVIALDDDYSSMLMLAAIIRGRILGSFDYSVLEVLESLIEDEDGGGELDHALLLGIMQHIHKIAVHEYGEKDMRSARYLQNTVRHICELDKTDRPLKVTLDVLSVCIQHVSKVVTCHALENHDILELLFRQCVLLIYLCLMDDTSGINKHIIESNFKEVISNCPNDDISKTFIHCVLDGILERDIPFHKETFLKFLVFLISNKINVSYVDSERRSPLHKFCLCPSSSEKNTDVVHRTARLLLDNGNHICMEDLSGLSVIELLQCISYPVHGVRDRTLQCLAATKIANSSITHTELPPHLETFIYQHEYHYPSPLPSPPSSPDLSMDSDSS